MKAGAWSATLHTVSTAGQIVLVALGLAWATLEAPAPVVNVRWQEDVTPAARREAERTLHLARAEEADGTWRYELASPRSATIAAIVAHPGVEDTHNIDRGTATLSPDAGRGTLRVWWAGPFIGERGRVQFRVLFGLIGAA
ncbi:MAG: hypothetical protein HOP14_14385, partial [Acidobacteria bacterium]|nr:hypothetical protein [Acidobacteriota bacterium]